MSTRLRTVLEVEGCFFYGKKLKNFLADFFPGTISFSIPEIRAMVAKFPSRYKAGLYIYREPRRVRFNRSRYKRLAAKFGFARVAKKKNVLDLRYLVRYPEVAPQPPQPALTWANVQNLRADLQTTVTGTQAAQTPQPRQPAIADEEFWGIDEPTERTRPVPRLRQTPPRG